MAQQAPNHSSDAITHGTWTVNPEASHVRFNVRTMWGLVNVGGSFDRFSGTMTVQPHGAGGELVIEADSLDTNNAKRDEHLRTRDFFHVEEHPRIVFTTAAITPREGGLTVSGDVRIGDNSVRVQLPVDVYAAEDRLRMRTQTSISRESVGMTWNKLGMIRGDVHLDLDLELALEG